MRAAITVSILFFVMLIQAGCGRTAEFQDRRDERDPYIQRGDARERVGDIDGAIEYYHRALERRPTLALAHLKLALKYDSAERGEYLRAVHHYHRYMELRPHAAKREMIEEMIRQAHLSYLASMPNPPPGAITRIALLEQERDMLRRRVQELEEREAGPVAEQAPTIRTAPSREPAPPAPAPPQDEVETYVVKPGDSLSSIAARLYRDPDQWRRIYEANRSTLPSPDSVRVGQTLIIPR